MHSGWGQEPAGLDPTQLVHGMDFDLRNGLNLCGGYLIDVFGHVSLFE